MIIESMEIVKNKQNRQVLGPTKFLKIKKIPVKTGEDRPVWKVGPGWTGPDRTGPTGPDRTDRSGTGLPVRFQVCP